MRFSTKSMTALCLAFALFGPAAAADRIIATVPFARGLGTAVVLAEGHLQLCGGLPEGCNSANRLDLPPINNESQGITVWADAQTPDFPAYVALITNGVKDPAMAMFELGGGDGWAGFEPQFFGNQVGPNGIDLAGFVIHRIGFRVDSVSIVSPGSDPSHNGVWTDASVAGAFLFEGTCAHLPDIATLHAVTARICGRSASIALAAPGATSTCNAHPAVTGVAFTPNGRLPTRVVNGHITLALGEHKLLWTVNDSYHTAMSQQAVTVAKKTDCRP